ncbi:MAG: RsiV family protein [Muribaculaceae bacterium]|nr:RsiV family protein [Muribaculaceae bacterium]
MKKKLFGVAVVGLLLLASACGTKENNHKDESNGETVVENLSFESYKFERIGEFEDSDSLAPDGERYVRYISEGVLPRDLGSGGARMLRDSLMRMALIVEGEDGKPAPLMPDSMERVYHIPDSIINCGFVYTSLSTTLLTPRVVVWEVERETYAYHAAHANRFTGFVNYNLTNGKIINLSDLMKPGYEGQLTKMVQEKVQEEDIQLLVDPEEIKIPRAFAITSDGLLFSFNPYAIAPYSEGFVKIDVSTEEIYDLLSKEGLFILTGESR